MFMYLHVHESLNSVQGPIFIQTNTETGISFPPVLCGIDTFCDAIGNISLRLFIRVHLNTDTCICKLVLFFTVNTRDLFSSLESITLCIFVQKSRIMLLYHISAFRHNVRVCMWHRITAVILQHSCDSLAIKRARLLHGDLGVVLRLSYDKYYMCDELYRVSCMNRPCVPCNSLAAAAALRPPEIAQNCKENEHVEHLDLIVVISYGSLAVLRTKP